MRRRPTGTTSRRLAKLVRGAAATCLFLCPAGTARAQDGAVAQGTVRHAVSGAPVANATVRVVGASVTRTTGADGRFRLAVEPGSVELRVVAVGFAPASQIALVTPGAVATVDLFLQPSAVALDRVVTIGSRVQGRSQTESPVPIDVVSAQELENTGSVETWQQLQRLVPSVNVPHIPLGDNHMRPVTLRGLDPHHTLVLVNGKRRHPAAALLAGPSVPNRSFTDIGSIPSAAIERIEVLRDGAAAQYGSDAIAGVVNIVLKGGDPRELRATAARIVSSEGGREFGDGRTIDVGTALGIVTRGGGHVTGSAQLLDREGTNRAYPDRRAQYFTGDPRNDAPAQVRSHFGDGSLRDASLFLDASKPIAGAAELYAFGGAAGREGVSPDAIFRRPLDARTVRAIHPDGFLPVVESRVGDLSGAAGVRGTSRDWRWDLSSVWGGNRVAYRVRNSNNASLGAASPTEFYAGRLSTDQWTSNADVSRELRLRPLALTLSGGVEYRVERFRIGAGDPDSWRDGRVPIADGPQAGLLAAAGAQGLTGFRPMDEVAPRRSSSAAYLEADSRIGKRLLLQTAGRAERSNDFGSTTNGKLAGRVELWRGAALRGAASTGFRAPALMQEYLARTSLASRTSGGVTTFLLVRTFPVNTPEARLMGATPLRPETSANVSAGAVLELPRLALITADYYRIDIHDRIGATGSTTDTAIIRIFEENGFRGIGGGGYFKNAWDTRTEGLDLAATRSLVLRGGAMLQLAAGYNRSKTKITHVAALPPELATVGRELASRSTRGVIEQGQPQETFTGAANYSIGQIGVNVDGRRSGATAQLDATDPAGDVVLPAKWITNARLSYQLRPRVRLSLSALNLFDVYPGEWTDFKDGLNARGFSMQGILRYPGALSPFGMNGRSVSLQLGYR